MSSRTFVSVAASVSAAVALTACGSSASSAPSVDVAAGYAKTPVAQVVADAKSAMSALKSFHVVAHNPTGKDAGDFDLTFTSTGCHLVIAQPTGHLEVIGIGGTMYVRADAAFWKANAGARTAAALADRWTTSAKYASMFGAKCSVAGDVADLFAADNLKSPGLGAATKTTDGKPAVTLTFVDKDNAHDSVLVLATAPHLFVSGTADDGSSFTVNNVGADVTFTAPAGAVNIDGSATAT